MLGADISLKAYAHQTDGYVLVGINLLYFKRIFFVT